MIFINNTSHKSPRKVMKCDPGTLRIVKIYNSLSEAAEDMSGNVQTNISGIRKVANGSKPVSYEGFVWRWKPLEKFK